MADATSIEWTDATWNPVVGCSVISPGCTNCYAMRMAARIERMQAALGNDTPYKGLTRSSKAGPVWTGETRVAWHQLEQPLSWRKPRRIFVNSMSDLFHESLPWEEIAQVYGTGIAAVHLRGHILQILTKRSGRMRELLHREEFWQVANAAAASAVMERVDPLDRRRDDARATLDHYDPDHPPPGIWLGASTEDQPRFDERVPELVITPAEKRFISAEPLLGTIDAMPFLFIYTHTDEALLAADAPEPPTLPWNDPATTPAADISQPRLDWVIVGGESGPHARPTDPDWMRSLRDQCQAAEVPFFFKQWGEWLVATADPKMDFRFGDGEAFPIVSDGHDIVMCEAQDHRGAPKKIWREFWATGDGRLAKRPGKKAAGAVLDGREWREFPT